MKLVVSLSRKIGLGFAAGLVVLIFIGIVSFLGIRGFIHSAEIVTRTHRILTLIEAALGDLASAESETRGYFITGKAEYLAVYQSALNDIDQDFIQLHALVMDPRLHQRLKDFEKLARQRLERLSKIVTERQTQQSMASLDLPSAGKALMDEIRRVVSEMQEIENELLRERAHASAVLATRTTWVIVLGSVLAILLAAFSTLVLTADVAHRELLEREVLEISEREQRRIGQDLHDGVCQHLTGISLLSRSLQQKLADRGAAETAEATRITSLINDGIEQTRRVTHGLHPVANEPTGLMVALQELANGVHTTNQLTCIFECVEPVLIPDQMAATHLYRIAQEAVQNAIRHAQATTINIHLTSDEASIVLTITDDGCGLPQQRQRRPGLGLDIMTYRANTLGALLVIRCGAERGTVVSCRMPRSEFT